MASQNMIKYNKQKVFYKGFIGRILSQGKNVITALHLLSYGPLKTYQLKPMSQFLLDATLVVKTKWMI